MFNVLPEIYKNEIRDNYRIRRWLVILLALLFLQISFLFLFFPSWLISMTKKQEVASEMRDISKLSEYQNTNLVSSVVKTTNLKLKMINTTLEYPKLLPIVNSILDFRTSGIRISQVMYTSSASSSAAISLSGTASTRDSLVTFVKTLEQSHEFSNVDSPISNLAKDKNIDFTINLKVSN